MSHANAALTPVMRLRMARLIVEQGWPSPRRRTVPGVLPTAKRWETALPAARPGRHERRAAHARTSPRTGPRSRWSARSCGCDEHRLGPVQIAGRVAWPLDRARGPGPLPAQPALPHRPGHRGTGPPLRAPSPRLADPRRRQEARQHPRRRRLALRGSSTGPAQQGSPTPASPGTSGTTPRWAPRSSTRSSTTTPGWPTPSSTTTRPPPPRAPRRAAASPRSLQSSAETGHHT